MRKHLDAAAKAYGVDEQNEFRNRWKRKIREVKLDQNQGCCSHTCKLEPEALESVMMVKMCVWAGRGWRLRRNGQASGYGLRGVLVCG